MIVYEVTLWFRKERISGQLGTKGFSSRMNACGQSVCGTVEKEPWRHRK